MNINLLEKMIDICKAKYANCYNPYSRFSVVSSVIMNDDKETIYGGANIENASYGLTMCAERVAIYNAISNSKSRVIKAILVFSDDISNFIYPCGACRQVINEFSDENTRIVVANNKNILYYAIDELLPKSFGPRDLAL